jgi:hypothetical protein
LECFRLFINAVIFLAGFACTALVAIVILKMLGVKPVGEK